MKHYQFFKAFLYVTASCILLGCGKELDQEGMTFNAQEQAKFTLMATSGSANTKVTFDDDGLNMTWQPGDVLYMIDVTGNNSTVTLTTDIEKPSKTANFTTDKSVLSGEYIVVYGQNDLNVSKVTSMKSTSNLSNEIRLYGALSVSDGQTAASISLKQLYAMLTFKFKNLPIDLTNMRLGMAATEGGTPDLGSGKITQNGLTLSSSYSQNINFYWNDGEDSKVLIAPADFSNNKIYFFIYGTNTSGQHVTYEFLKDGKKLAAGRNYNLTFDFSKATKVSTLVKSSVKSNAYVLSKPEDFRAAAYWGGMSYSVEADVDFSGEVYFPISGRLYGNKHSLSNITVNLAKCAAVGVVSDGSAENIIVKNSSFIGNYRVGSIIGLIGFNDIISGCCGDCVSVQGNSAVGGLFGAAYNNSASSITSCSLLGTSTVNSTGSSVGGIIGDSRDWAISKCLVKGTIKVKGTDYVGGIVGYSNGKDINSCGFEGNVEGENNVGGISGLSKSVSLSYVHGDVTGKSYVGGISGKSSCTNSYHIGNTTGSSCIGGINGGSSSSSYSDSYYCYSYGTVSSGYGICQDLNSSYYKKNLTSCNALSQSATSSSYQDYCNCGPGKTFLSKLSVINGDEAYSTQVWKDIDAGCPLLQWQADGFGGNIDIPGFDNEDW